MKILIVHRNSFDVIGGVESTLYYMAETLRKMGHTPVIVAQQGKESNDQNAICKVVRYSPSRLYKKYFCLFLPFIACRNAKKKLKNILEQEKPDYIIVRDNILSYVLSQIFDRSKIVYIPLGVIRYYSTGLRKFSSVKSFIIECIRFVQMKQESRYQIKAFKNLTKIVVFSENMKSQIKDAIGYNHHTHVIYPGVSSKFSPYTEADDIRREFHIAKDDKIFLFVGRVVQEKNVRMLIDAYANSDYKNTVLLIVGGGDDLSFIQNKVNELGLEHVVLFSGFRRDTEKFYREAAFFILPSYYESFGNVILESYASGTPVIGFKTEKGKTLTAIGELVEEGKSGIICENFSTEALTNAINRAVLVANSDTYSNMREYCADLADKKFTWNRFMEQVIMVLRHGEK